MTPRELLENDPTNPFYESTHGSDAPPPLPTDDPFKSSSFSFENDPTNPFYESTHGSDTPPVLPMDDPFKSSASNTRAPSECSSKRSSAHIPGTEFHQQTPDKDKDNPKQAPRPKKSKSPEQAQSETKEQKDEMSTDPTVESPPDQSPESPCPVNQTPLIDNTGTFHSKFNIREVDKIDSYWVTVSGIPPSALSLALTKMSICGISVEGTHTEGLWTQIKIQYMKDVQRARSIIDRIMEPMTLGSAPSSPSSPTSAHPTFLPSFLMGDTSQPATPNPSTSPGRPRTPGRRTGPSGTPDSRNMYPRLFNQTLDSPKQSFTPRKPGPPSQGLFETLEQKKMPTSPMMQSTAIESPSVFGRSRLADDSFNCSRNFNESLNLSRVDKIDTHWVTVFGFPPSALSLILTHMSNCGIIAEKIIPPQGNWVHVKFNHLSDVPRALSLNGRCIKNSNIMIGVSLHYHNENKENDDKIFTSPIRARPLRQSFISPHNNSVLTPQNVPQKSTGLVSKAIEYVFGW